MQLLLQWTPSTVTAGLILAWNLAVFCLYGVDKGRARRGDSRRRIPEKTLLLTALALGGLGGLGGMLVFRHKTRHLQFALLLPLFFLLTLFALVYVLAGFRLPGAGAWR